MTYSSALFAPGDTLAARGRVGLQAITMPHDRMLATRGGHTWIHKYIFPGGQIPSLQAITETLREHTRLHVSADYPMGSHYARTLAEWRRQFLAAAGNVSALGFGTTFQRMWNLYLAYSEAGFRLGFVELPAIGLQWQPARSVIDGGMATAIHDQKTRRRTLTVYADIRRVTVPLSICDRNTIWLFLVDRTGQVRWRGSGGYDAAAAAALTAALAELPGVTAAPAPAAGPGAGQFEMAFDPRFRLPLAALGVTPATTHK